MSFVSMKELLDEAARDGYAVPAFSAWNAEVMDLVLRTAERMRAPVIVMQGPAELVLLPPATMAAVARAVESRSAARAALHLDHGDSVEKVQECLDAGYTSVMLDFSTRRFEENAQALRRVVELAHPLGVPVEGEIGRVGRADVSSTEGSGSSTLTDPAEAADFVERTGVDFLAVSVGNKHGFYTGDPHMEFGLLEELHAAVSVPLVLHGGTGIPERDIRRAVGAGIAKVNVASELVAGVRSSLAAQWAAGRNPWVAAAMAEAVAGVQKVVEKWIRVTGAEGRA